ncbi:thioesterase family protein [Lentzea albidocapillata]|uniref:Thioesterase-like superfamily protein n=1 Tax=Lentzea albidocapillata TaxID=40571 RepID=A0A1W2DNN3_9PSEU|nr:thioesterase family protein [Lentzea albidocapillata]SMC98993.1 Thioesterase-like superfamily protein [Lentzea albidocapillata]
MPAFYLPLGGDTFRSTEHTVGPWGPDSQHLGPPSALLVRSLLALDNPSSALARVTFEVLGPVPVADLTVSTSVERPGRSVELLAASLSHEGRTVLTARAWRIVTSDTASVAGGEVPALAPPESAVPMEIPEHWGGGYLAAVEWLSVSGGIFTPGDARVWARPRVAVVEGSEPSPEELLFAVVDSASGVSSRVDIRKWYAINTDLTVHLHRRPVGEWVGMDARTTIGPDGVGLATSVVHDVAGPVGTTAQALFVRER